MNTEHKIVLGAFCIGLIGICSVGLYNRHLKVQEAANQYEIDKQYEIDRQHELDNRRSNEIDRQRKELLHDQEVPKQEQPAKTICTEQCLTNFCKQEISMCAKNMHCMNAFVVLDSCKSFDDAPNCLESSTGCAFSKCVNSRFKQKGIPAFIIGNMISYRDASFQTTFESVHNCMSLQCGCP